MPYKNCPRCGGDLKEGWLRCPKCGKHLLLKCQGCEALLEAEWVACPYCGRDVSIEETIEIVLSSSVSKKKILAQEKNNFPEKDKSQPKILIAIDPHSSPNALRKIAEEELRNDNGGEDYFLRQALLKNLNTPPEFLYDLSFYNGKQKLLGEYLGNRNVNPEELCDILYNIKYYDKKKQITKDAMASLASNPSCPSNVLCQLINEKEYENEIKIVESIAENPNSPESLLLTILDCYEDNVRARISRNPSSSDEIFERLINGSLMEKESVASSPYIPEIIIKKLRIEPNKHVRVKLASNYKLPVESLKFLSNDLEIEVRQAVAKNKNTPLEILNKMHGVEKDTNTLDVIKKEIETRNKGNRIHSDYMPYKNCPGCGGVLQEDSLWRPGREALLEAEWIVCPHCGRDFSIDADINSLDKASNIDPDDADAWYAKGVELSESGKYQEAIECYDRVIEIGPDYASTWNNKGIALDNLGKYQEAIECYDRAIKLDPSDTSTWNNKGVALDNLGKYQEAIECYERAIEIYSDDAFAWNNKGVALDNLDKYQEAIECFDQSIEIDPEYARGWHNKGDALLNLGSYSGALQCYDRCIEIDPDDAGGWHNKGYALTNLGRYQEAIECFDQAIKLEPDYANAWHNKGVSLDNLGKYQEAIECYEYAGKLCDIE